MMILNFLFLHTQLKMQKPKANNQKFLTQLRKSYSAFSARAGDFADYPINLESYHKIVTDYEIALTEATQYETNTVGELRAAQEAYREAVATARTQLNEAKACAESVKVAVKIKLDTVRTLAENEFQRYQSIAEAVYLGSDRDYVLAEFLLPAGKHVVAKKIGMTSTI